MELNKTSLLFCVFSCVLSWDYNFFLFALETKETWKKQSFKELIYTDTWKRYSCLNNVSLTENNRKNCSKKLEKSPDRNEKNSRIRENWRNAKKLDEVELKKHANFQKVTRKLLYLSSTRWFTFFIRLCR